METTTTTISRKAVAVIPETVVLAALAVFVVVPARVALAVLPAASAALAPSSDTIP